MNLFFLLRRLTESYTLTFTRTSEHSFQFPPCALYALEHLSAGVAGVEPGRGHRLAQTRSIPPVQNSAHSSRKSRLLGNQPGGSFSMRERP